MKEGIFFFKRFGEGRAEDTICCSLSVQHDEFNLTHIETKYMGTR